MCLFKFELFKIQNYIVNMNKLLFLSVYIEKKQWSPALLPFRFCLCTYSNSRGSIFQLFINNIYYLCRYLFHMSMQFLKTPILGSMYLLLWCWRVITFPVFKLIPSAYPITLFFAWLVTDSFFHLLSFIYTHDHFFFSGFSNII